MLTRQQKAIVGLRAVERARQAHALCIEQRSDDDFHQPVDRDLMPLVALLGRLSIALPQLLDGNVPEWIPVRETERLLDVLQSADVRLLRNVVEHEDDYLIGKGRDAHGLGTPIHTRPFYEMDLPYYGGGWGWTPGVGPDFVRFLGRQYSLSAVSEALGLFVDAAVPLVESGLAWRRP